MWSNPSGIFPRLSPHFIFWADDNGAYLQSLNSLVARNLNAEALEIFRQSNGQASVNEIIERVTSLNEGATLSRVRKDVCSFLDTMVQEGFLILDRDMKSPECVPPSTVYVSLTERCNLRCAFCYGYGMEPVGDLCENDWLYILSKVSGFVPQGSTLVFTGGEPTLSGSFGSIARAAREYGLRLQMYSNGTLFDEKFIDFCAGLGFDMIGISVHGANATTADAISGVPGSFNRAIAAIAGLSAMGVPVAWQATLSRRNLGEVQDMAKLAASLGVSEFRAGSIDFHELLSQPAGCEPLEAAEEVHLWKILQEIKAEMPQRMRIGREDEFCRVPLENNYDAIDSDRTGACGVGCHICHIRADGHLTPCPVLKRDPWDLGSLLHSDFNALWSGAPALKPLRLNNPEDSFSCGSCGLRAYCRGGCRANAFFSSQNILGCDLKKKNAIHKLLCTDVS